MRECLGIMGGCRGEGVDGKLFINWVLSHSYRLVVSCAAACTVW
jgi:hypothetical protein